METNRSQHFVTTVTKDVPPCTRGSVEVPVGELNSFIFSLHSTRMSVYCRNCRARLCERYKTVQLVAKVGSQL